MSKKRYCATIQVYLHAEDDASAVRSAIHIAEGLRAKEDGRAEVVGVVEHPFGSIHSRDVDIKSQANPMPENGANKQKQ